MANNILTIVFETVEKELDSVIAAAVNELHNIGHVVKEVRVTTDTGENKVPLNQVKGITPTEPTPEPEPAPVAEPEPTNDTPPVDVPPAPAVTADPTDAAPPTS